MDREKVIAWLTEISLRPCDFTRDDYDAYETEQLANDAIEIVKCAEIFCKQRNDALALLKEQEAENVVDMKLSKDYFLIASCQKCNALLTRVEHRNYCGYCGQAVKW